MQDPPSPQERMPTSGSVECGSHNLGSTPSSSGPLETVGFRSGDSESSESSCLPKKPRDSFRKPVTNFGRSLALSCNRVRNRYFRSSERSRSFRPPSTPRDRGAELATMEAAKERRMVISRMRQTFPEDSWSLVDNMCRDSKTTRASLWLVNDRLRNSETRSGMPSEMREAKKFNHK